MVNGVISDVTVRAEKSLDVNPLSILSIPSSAMHQTAAYQSPKTSTSIALISLQLTHSDKKQFLEMLVQ